MTDARPHLLVLVPLEPERIADLERVAQVHRLDLASDPEAVMAAVGPTIEIVVTDGHRGLSAAEIARLPRLAMVASGSAGMEGIDRAALAERGIAVANTAPALADEVADLAMLLALAAWHGLAGLDAHVRTGAWAREGAYPLGRSLTGRTLGLVGIGTIGGAIARRAAAFGMKVAYHARHARPVPWRHEPDLLALATASDILVVATPGGDATRGLVSAAVIDALGPEGVLVNIARGSVIDEPAMILALSTGRLGAAGLDVFASEPAVDPALTALPNVVLTPHAGSATRETRDAMERMVVDNVAAHVAGLPLPGAV